jgi:multisubunit Na+/H+ antiporter MnhB subunit
MSDEKPQQLGYATRIGEYPDPRSHKGWVVWLIGLNALAGIWLLILGLFYSIDLRLYGIVMIASGAVLCWVSLGKLPYPQPRFGAALLLLSFAFAGTCSLVVLSQNDLTPREARYGKFLTPPSNIRARPTMAEREVFTFEMIRNANAASAAVCGMLWMYSFARVLRNNR